MFVVREKWVETRTDCYIDPSSSSTIAAFLPQLGWVAQPWVTEGHKAGSHAGILSPTDSNRRAPGYIIFQCSPASAVLPLIYTGASLDWWLGRGSVYNTGPPHVYPVGVRRLWVWIFMSRIYEEFHINLWECSMYGYCYIFLFRFI